MFNWTQLLLLLPASSVTTAFSVHSSFTNAARVITSNAFFVPSTATRSKKSLGRWTMYENPSDRPSGNNDAWSVLSNTEKWISNTLKSSNAAAGASSSGSGGGSNTDSSAAPTNNNNPYARKEVSYVCENQSSAPMIVSSIFRLLREARERGEAHGESEEQRAEDLGDAYKPSTMRQTQVVVIPGNAEFNDSFSTFDNLINAINQARRNARDYITDIDIENGDDDDDSSSSNWITAINCAHLHPSFGEKTAAERLQEMRDQDAAGEVDVNYEQYKAARLAARRSPYPTVVIEVKASPAPDFTGSPPPSSSSSESSVAAADIQKLEALFGKSALDNGNNGKENSFWDNVGNSIEEVAALTPVKLAEQWISANRIANAAAFTESQTEYVDAAYEFVFANIAMLCENGHDNGKSTSDDSDAVPTHYVVFPRLMSTAATSFEKFANEVANIVATLPELTPYNIDISTYHPEHVDSNRRSPVPIFAITSSSSSFGNTQQ